MANHSIASMGRVHQFEFRLCKCAHFESVAPSIILHRNVLHRQTVTGTEYTIQDQATTSTTTTMHSKHLFYAPHFIMRKTSSMRLMRVLVCARACARCITICKWAASKTDCEYKSRLKFCIYLVCGICVHFPCSCVCWLVRFVRSPIARAEQSALQVGHHISRSI